MDLQNFRPIKDFEDRYFVSVNGEVYSKKTKRLLKPLENEKGYLSVELWRNYKRVVKKIHRLVAETFLENPRNLKEINHKDGNKQNNRAENLEWCTRSENLKHAYKMGLRITHTQNKLNQDKQLSHKHYTR